MSNTKLVRKNQPGGQIARAASKFMEMAKALGKVVDKVSAKTKTSWPIKPAKTVEKTSIRPKYREDNAYAYLNTPADPANIMTETVITKEANPNYIRDLMRYNRHLHESNMARATQGFRGGYTNLKNPSNAKDVWTFNPKDLTYTNSSGTTIFFDGNQWLVLRK